MNFKKKLSSLKVPHHKNTAGVHSVRVSPPGEVILPMKMHSGSPAVPVVTVGDYVRVGQLIAKEEGRFSSPVHATVSGTVKEVGPYTQADGKEVMAIRIESDGKMEADPAIKAPEAKDLDEFLAVLRESGIVGLGGAAFPLWAKLDAARRAEIHTVLVNGAECEPFITADHRTMLEQSDYIKKGIELLKKYIGSKRFVIGIEDNKQDAIDNLNKVFADDPAVEIMSLKSVYPQGAKQVLLYNVTGNVVKSGQRLASFGVIIINVTTLAKMAYFMETGMPLVDKCITVDGSAIKEPKNIIVPIGTPASYLIEQAGGLSTEPGKVLIGGPMMGVAVQDLNAPVQKATNAVLVFNKKDAAIQEPTACIHCGRCVSVCPIKLNPTAFDHAMEIEDEQTRLAVLNKECIMQCIECACCSFACPAHRPLMQTNKDAKEFVWAMKAKASKE